MQITHVAGDMKGRELAPPVLKLVKSGGKALYDEAGVADIVTLAEMSRCARA